MKRQLAVCAWLLVFGIGSAQAQTVYAGPGPFEPSAVLPPYEIMSIVRSTGLAPLTRPMRRGSYYVLVAVDRVGRQMRVVVDAELGDIVNMRPATAAGPFGPEPGRPVSAPTAGAPPLPDTTAAYGARPGAESAGGSYSPGPALPRSAPAPHITPTTAPAAAPASAPAAAASPQTRMAVAEPALPPPPPLPRPRPKLALNDAPQTAPVTTTATTPGAKLPPPPAPVSAQPLPSTSPSAADPGQIE